MTATTKPNGAASVDNQKRPAKTRFAGPIAGYAPPWWWDIPYQRKRGPSYRLTPRQVSRLISNIEYWLARDSHLDDSSVEEANSRDLIEAIRQGRGIEPFDGEMPQSDSQDSYNCFARKNPHMCLSLAELKQPTASPYERSAAEQQSAWEAMRRARQTAREAEAQRSWDAESSRRIGQTFWANLSSQFVDQPLVQIRTGSRITILRDETEPWSVRFEPNQNYSVPKTAADILVRTAGSRLVLQTEPGTTC